MDISQAESIPPRILEIMDYPISAVALVDEQTLKLNFNGDTKCLIFRAMDEVSDYNWFDYPNGKIGTIIGKYLVGVREEEIIDKLVSESKRIFEITLSFKDNSQFKFIRKHESNGYYDGWLSLDIK